MTRRFIQSWKVLPRLALVGVAACLFSLRLLAADDPFADAPDKPAAAKKVDAAEAADKPDKAAKKEKAAKTAKAPGDDDAKAAGAAPVAAKSPPKSESPAVAAIRESNPTTPAQLVRSIDALVAFDATPLARDFLKRLLAIRMTDAQLAELAEMVGPEPLIRMAKAAQLGPEAARFAQRVLEAAHKAQTSPQRLAELIRALKSDNSEERAAAVVDLSSAGQASIGPLVRVLADPAQKSIHAYARQSLVSIGPPAVEPLVAVLDTAGAELKAEVLAVLYHLADEHALFALLAESASPNTTPQAQRLAAAGAVRVLGSLPTRTAIVELLDKTAGEYLRGQRSLPADLDGQYEIWQWDAASGDFANRKLPVRTASALYAAWLARRLHELSPESPRAERLHLLSNLQAAKLLNGLGEPLSQGPGRAAYLRAAGRGVETIEKVLADALAENCVPAAVAAVEVLGDSGDRSQLSRGSAASPLVRAADHPDRRLRSAAMQAIVKLAPSQPFAGASLVPRAIQYFAHFGGMPRAVVADPRADRASQLGALLDQAGFKTTVTINGHDLFQAAVASPEVELALVELTVEGPRATELIRQLRRDPRTARLPIGLIADPDELLRANAIAQMDPLIAVFVRPSDPATMKERVATLSALEGVDYVPAAERAAEASAALTALARLSESRQSLFDLSGQDATVEPALYVPSLSPTAITVLGRLATARAQRTLVNLASETTEPLEIRRAAVAAFTEALRREGIQLTIAEIKEQARRYDKSASLDRPTQDVLWSVLDALQKTKKIRNSEFGIRK